MKTLRCKNDYTQKDDLLKEIIGLIGIDLNTVDVEGSTMNDLYRAEAFKVIKHDGETIKGKLRCLVTRVFGIW